jgi:hypothetical protein
MVPRFFLSCSFRPDDKPVVELIRAIADGLGMPSINVSTAYTSVPPAEARRMIAETAGVIAIATRREPNPDSTWLMPPAVHDEIAIAYALRKPLLLFCEADVRTEGFVPTYGTYLSFDRSAIHDPATLAKIVNALSTFRGDALFGREPATTSPYAYYSESVRRLCELEKAHDTLFAWSISTTRRIVFRQHFDGVIRTSWWCSDTERTAPPDAPAMQWEARATAMSRPFEIKFDPRLVTADTIDIRISLTPEPEPEDSFEFIVNYRSPYLNPMFADTRPRASIRIAGQDYFATDGIVPSHEIRHLRMQWRFPADYGLQLHDVKTFAGGFSNGVDDLNEGETKRLGTAAESFAGNLVLDLTAEGPLLRHKYGIAWRLPTRP